MLQRYLFYLFGILPCTDEYFIDLIGLSRHGKAFCHLSYNFMVLQWKNLVSGKVECKIQNLSSSVFIGGYDHKFR